MLFHKIDAPENFSFGENRKVRITPRLTSLGEGVFRYEVRSSLWKTNFSQAVLDETVFDKGPADAEVELKPDGGVAVSVARTALIETRDGEGFGLSGRRWMMVFDYHSDMRFYGMGEKFGRLEKTGVRTRFWNTDVMADFPRSAVDEATVDPLYVSVPYLLVVRPEGAVGILVDNPFPSFMSVASPEELTQRPEERVRPRTYLGAPDGKPVIYFIAGRNAMDVTRKLQRLSGPTPLPPVWALGHHQSRWGYRSTDDLRAVAEQFERYSIPNDGLWLDIDYMDGYRIFTFDRESYPDPAADLRSLSQTGRVCPILDPGLKVDPEYGVYREAVDQELLCLNGEGRPYVGFVWPGSTVFPDFSLEKTRDWWAGHVKEFAEKGVAGVWVDMNDPSTGSADLDDMRFSGGELAHETYHNQYALGMQMATRAGFLEARPHERPFVLSRSGYISTSRYAAVWTGDSVSNYANLRQAIPMCLNLSLSGIPFVGGDVGGFDGDATPELLVDWYKATFLFPVFRNHSCKKTRNQEPWAMGVAARNAIARYIRLRYKLLPYLYSLFDAQETAGEPMLRPLFLEFPAGCTHDLSRVGDQFMVGSAILQAPFAAGGETRRSLVLPADRPGGSWYDPSTGGWVRGNRKLTVEADSARTPLYFREGTVVPMLRGVPRTAASDFGHLEVHLFLSRKSRATRDVPASASCIHDDGHTFEYRNGARSVVRLRAWVERTVLHIDASDASIGYKAIELEFVVYDQFSKVIVHRGDEKPAHVKPFRWECAGSTVACTKTAPFLINR